MRVTVTCTQGPKACYQTLVTRGARGRSMRGRIATSSEKRPEWYSQRGTTRTTHVISSTPPLLRGRKGTQLYRRARRIKRRRAPRGCGASEGCGHVTDELGHVTDELGHVTA
eukprot:1790755-Rhodomonas_salina.1